MGKNTSNIVMLVAFHIVIFSISVGYLILTANEPVRVIFASEVDSHSSNNITEYKPSTKPDTR